MITLREAASGLLNAVESAIQSGDWKVDGVCDPSVEIIRLKNILAKPIKESFNASTNVKEAFNLDRGCWERGCMAYDTRDCDEGVTVYVDAVNISQERVDETVKREHEPVARVDYNRSGNIAWLYGPVEPDGTLLYTEPPKREWVGLTDREITKIGNLDWDSAYVGIWYDFAKGIEAKLKEKNT